MSTKIKILISCVFLVFAARSQNVVSVYKIADLMKRIDTSKTTIIVNFWATWCKTCVQELPAFDSLSDHQTSYLVQSCELERRCTETT